MNIAFDSLEARVMGCLIEKEITTPDQYPLSINSLTAACNQKTNREPVMELSEAQAQQAIDSLMKKHLVSDRSAGYGGRVTKYRHRLCNTEFGSCKMSAQELGIICVLLLRGPQTPGELRSRTQRLCAFADVEAVESTLEGLMSREDGPFVTRLARAAGAREARYMHLFCGDVEAAAAAVETPRVDAVAIDAELSIAALTRRVALLEESLAELRHMIGVLKAQA